MESDRKTTEGPESCAPDRKIDLSEICSVLLKRKNIILGVLFVTLMMTAIYVYFSKPIYESRAAIRIGQVKIGAQATYIELPEVLIYRLKLKYASEIKLPAVKSITNDKKGLQEVIVLTVQGYSPSQAQDLLIKVIDELLLEHQASFGEVKDIQQQRMQSLSNRIEEVENNVKEYDKNIVILKDNNPTLASLLALEKNNLLETIPVLENDLAQSKTEALKAFTFATEVIQKPTKPVKPIFPRKALLLIAAVIIGTILGIVFAFAIEYKKKDPLEIQR